MTSSPLGVENAVVGVKVNSSSSNGDNATEQLESAVGQSDGQEPQLELLTEFQPPDGGCFAWLVCFASFCTNGTLFSIINSFGIIGEWLIANHGTSKSLAGAIGSTAMGSLFFFSFLASVITDRLGIRPVAVAGGAICALGLLGSSFCDQPHSTKLLLLTYSFLFGFGAALVYTPSLVILGHYFDKRMGIANGIVTLGSGVFSIVLAKLMKPQLLDGLGLGNTFRLLAGMSLLIAACAAIWKPKRPARHSELDHYLSPRNSLVESVNGIGSFLSRFCNVSIWRSRSFIVWIIAQPIAMVGYFVPFAFLPNFLQQQAMLRHNITSDAQLKSFLANNNSNGDQLRRVKHSITTAESDAAILLMSINVASSVARLGIGRLADFHCCSRVHLQQIAFAAQGLSMLLIPLGRKLAEYIVLAILFGLSDGAVVCLIGPIAFDLVGPSGASQAIGFLLLAMSLPIALGPLLAGYMNDKTNRWDIPFYISGMLPIVSSLIFFGIPHISQTYPAVSIAEDFDQTAKSNLDIDVFNEGQSKDAQGRWSRVSSRLTSHVEPGFSTRRSLPPQLDSVSTAEKLDGRTEKSLRSSSV